MVNRLLCRPAAGSAAPRQRLFCFPYAGAGPGIFRTWFGRLPGDVDLIAVRMPGRESRFAEAPYTDWANLIDDAAAALRPLLDLPFLLFGHSFGGMLAYEIARTLQTSGAPLPEALIVSGCRCPHVRPRAVAPYDSPSERLWQWVSNMDGTPAAVLEDKEIRTLIEPALRADLKLAYTWSSGSRVVDVPIVTFGGVHDRIVLRGEIEGWRNYTVRPYRHVEFPGGHFFVHTVEPEVVATIASLCCAA
jgi:medium-chain acyl-[acyl-carrier-protein] hydrolase